MMNENYRWRILALLFLATTINYVDRQALSFVMTDEGFKKTLLGLSTNAVLTDDHLKRFRIEMGLIDSAFKATYAIGFLLAGWLIDKIGTRKGFAVGITIWSFASVASAFIATAGQLKVVRAVLGLGEATNFPSAMKAISEWFPKTERSTATGFLNAGSNMGVIATAALIPFLVQQFGWRISFLVSAVLGFMMLVIWLLSYNRPQESSSVSANELNYITQSQEIEKQAGEETRLSWKELIRFKQTWVFTLGKVFADPVWFFYLTWLPDFLSTNNQLDRKLDLKNFGLTFLIIYVVSDLGSIFFGWLATWLIRQGWTDNKARKVTMLICALLVTPMYLIPGIHNFGIVVALLAVAMAAHQGWSTNVYSMAATLFPSASVGSATGLGGSLGGLTSMGVAAATGYVVAAFGYQPMFIFASCSYLIGLIVIHLVLPVIKPVGLTVQQVTTAEPENHA